MKDELARSNAEVLKSALDTGFTNAPLEELTRAAQNMSTSEKVRVLINTIEKQLGRPLTAGEYRRGATDMYEQALEYTRLAEEAVKREAQMPVPMSPQPSPAAKA